MQRAWKMMNRLSRSLSLNRYGHPQPPYRCIRGQQVCLIQHPLQTAPHRRYVPHGLHLGLLIHPSGIPMGLPMGFLMRIPSREPMGIPTRKPIGIPLGNPLGIRTQSPMGIPRRNPMVILGLPMGLPMKFKLELPLEFAI